MAVISGEDRRALLAEVARRHGVRVEEFVQPGRRLGRRLCLARAEAAFCLRYDYGLSYTQVASIAGYLDHTSAIYGIKLHRERLGDPEVAEALAAKRERSSLKEILYTIRSGHRRMRFQDKASSLSLRMRKYLASGSNPEMARAVRYFVEWDGATLRWTNATRGKGGQELKKNLAAGSPGIRLSRGAILWILLTGAKPRGKIIHQRGRPFSTKSVFCNRESLHDYLLRVPEYGCLYRAPGRVEKAHRAGLPVLPPGDDGGRDAPADKGPSGPAQVPAFAHRESDFDRLPAL